MNFKIKRSETSIIVTKRIKRILAPIFFCIGVPLSIVSFLTYYTIFYNLEPINSFGLSVFYSVFSGFIEIFLAICAGLLLGAFYFCCWSEGWEIKRDRGEITLFRGFTLYKKKETYFSHDIISVYINKKALDELGMVHQYKLQLSVKNNKHEIKKEQNLLTSLEKDHVHGLGLEIITFLKLDFQLEYRELK